MTFLRYVLGAQPMTWKWLLHRTNWLIMQPKSDCRIRWKSAWSPKVREWGLSSSTCSDQRIALRSSISKSNNNKPTFEVLRDRFWKVNHSMRIHSLVNSKSIWSRVHEPPPPSAIRSDDKKCNDIVINNSGQRCHAMKLKASVHHR